MPEMLLMTAVLAAIIFFIHRAHSRHTASSYSPPDSSNIPSSHRGARHVSSAAQPHAPRHAAEQSSLSLFQDEEKFFKSKADPSRASRKISFENDQARLERERLILAKEKAAHDAMRVFRDEADFEEQQRITEQASCCRDYHTFGEMVIFLLKLLWRLIKWIFTGIGMLFLFYIASSRDASSNESRRRSDSSFDSHRSARSNGSPSPESASRPVNSISSSPASPNNIHSSHSRHTASSHPSGGGFGGGRSGGGGSTRGGGTGGRF